MADELILDRYEPLGTAGSGGFATVQVAWDPRIQRKVAIKTILLTEQDAQRAGLPGADARNRDAASLALAAPPVPARQQAPAGQRAPAAPSAPAESTADRWHGVQPWGDYLRDLAESDASEHPGAAEEDACAFPDGARDAGTFTAGTSTTSGTPGGSGSGGGTAGLSTLAHLPGLDEARTAGRLGDPRIVTVYDFEVRGRVAYLIMEYVEGITCTRLLADYADYLTLDVVAAVFDAVAGALVAAHEAGVLHLDIKPDNILINAKGEVKVTDFGLATLADASGRGTAGGGTIGYMPLEQMRRAHLDARTDEWSLASVAYEMLTGDNPFRTDSLGDAEHAIEDAELVLPSLCWEDADEQIDDVIFYALAPDAEERYATVKDFAEEADKFLGDADAGREQIAALVKDALGLNLPAADEGDGPDEEAGQDAGKAPARRGIFARLFEGGTGESALSPTGPTGAAHPRNRDVEADDEDERDRWEGEDGRAGASGATSAATRRRRAGARPEAHVFSPRALGALARIFGAVASGLIMGCALLNLPILGDAFGEGAPYVIAAGMAACAALGALRAHIGALLSLCAVGIALLLSGHPLAGGALATAAIAWWAAIGRTASGPAPANVALLAPLASSLGGASIIPLVSGAALRPTSALATTALAAVISCLFAGFEPQAILGWNLPVRWSFTGVDVTGNVIALVTQPATWATVAGWLACSAALSLCSATGRRWMRLVGLALGCTLLVIGSIALTEPTPQLIVSVTLCTAALAALLARHPQP